MEEASDVHRRCWNGNVALLSGSTAREEITCLYRLIRIPGEAPLERTQEPVANPRQQGNGIHAREDHGIGRGRRLSPVEL